MKRFLLLLLLTISPILSLNSFAQSDSEIRAKYSSELAKVQEYLNSFQNMQTSFTQINYNKKGKLLQEVKGSMYFAKPDKIRVEYDKEVMPVVIVANSKFITYHDIELDQISHLKTKNTILFLLLQKVIGLDDKITLTNLEFLNNKKSIKISFYYTKSPNDGDYSMTFNWPDVSLSSLGTKSDFAGIVEAKVDNISYPSAIDKRLFKIEDPRLKKAFKFEENY